MDKFDTIKLTNSNWARWKPQYVGLLEYKGWDEALTQAAHGHREGLWTHEAAGGRQHAQCDTASKQAAWEALTQLFTVTANSMQLKKRLNSLVMQPKNNTTAYFTRVRRLQQELSEANTAITDNELVVSLLAGLPQEFATIRTVLTASDEATDATVLSRLLNEEATHKEKAVAPAFYMGNRNKGRRHKGPRCNNGPGGYHNDNGGEQHKGVHCHYCKTKGAPEKGLLQEEGRHGPTAAWAQQQLVVEQPQPHTQQEWWGQHRPYQGVFMAAANPTELWHLDSAAGEYWSTDEEIIFDLQDLDTPAPVMYANGETSSATQADKVMPCV